MTTALAGPARHTTARPAADPCGPDRRCLCDPPCAAAGREPGTLRNPAYETRVALVSLACTLPGALAGLLAAAALPVASGPAPAGVAGAVLAAAVGAWAEARS